MNQKQPIKTVSIVRVELAKDWGHPYANLEVENPKDLASVLKNFLKKTDREVFLTINLSGTNEINSINIVSMGCLTSTTVHPREVFKAAILSNAFRIVIAHNHPSGTSYPSQEDIDMTRKLIQCGEILDIKVMDHIIIAGKEYLSFAEKGIGGCNRKMEAARHRKETKNLTQAKFLKQKGDLPNGMGSPFLFFNH